MASKQQSLGGAKAAKQDEFYTQLSDIEKELRNYKKHFEGKVVYLNCDDPRESEFFHFFSYNFEKLGLKKLIAACYKSQDIDLFSTGDSERAVYLEYTGDKDGDLVPGRDEIEVKCFEGDGDFRSEESIALLKQADIVVTNPPFPPKCPCWVVGCCYDGQRRDCRMETAQGQATPTRNSFQLAA